MPTSSSPARAPQPHRPRAYLGAVGDSNDPATWSGTPYYFLGWSRLAGLCDEGLPLTTGGPAWVLRRLTWNAAQALRGERLGGYQYSSGFLERLWQPSAARLHGALVVSCFQLLASSIVHDSSIEKWYYIDQTLLQLFDEYGVRRTIGRRVARDAVAREREGYEAAAGIMTHSAYAAESVQRDYRIAPERVHVAVPGANIDSESYARWERTANPRPAAGPLRLVFVGRDWRRKGLDRLIEAFALARARAFQGTLRVIGCTREALPVPLRDVPGIEWLGVIDKRAEIDRFLALVSDADVGCLLSRAEAGGMVLREYQALGLVALGTEAGGAREHMLAGASIVVPVCADADAIAGLLVDLERDTARLQQMRATAWGRRREALWSATIHRIARVWPYPLIAA